MLASTSPRSLYLPSSHANTARLFPARRLRCWRRPPRKAFTFRRVTPTRPGFSPLAGSSVGVTLPAKPLSSVGPRQHGPAFPGSRAPVLASASSLSLCLPSSHANTARLSQLTGCIDRLPRTKIFKEKVKTRKKAKIKNVAFLNFRLSNTKKLLTIAPARVIFRLSNTKIIF